MPANLPPQYYELERQFKAELDNVEKLRMAQELLRIMPKHKGTAKVQADMKTKISKIKKLIAGGEKSHGARTSVSFDSMQKEGEKQIILVGPPNCGKSSLLDSLTHAKPLVADYPYSTREPMPGMMTFKEVPLQLIDTPPISEELYESYMSGLIRTADVVVIVVDLASETMEKDIEFILEKMEEKKINLIPHIPDEDAVYNKTSDKLTVISAHKFYEDESGEKLQIIKEKFRNFSVVPTSILDEDSLENLKQSIFEIMKIIRIFTKRIGHDPVLENPIILPVGGTVLQAAVSLHKDFGQKLKFAKLWGEGKYDGQKALADFVLADGDIIEFHM